MLERSLKPVERVAYPAASLMCVCFVIFFGFMAWSTWGKLPVLASLGFVSGGVFGVCFAAYSVRVFLRGRLHMKKDMSTYFGILWVFLVIMMTLFLTLGQQMENTEKGTQMILSGLVFFVMFGVVFGFQYSIQQAELRIRESVLKLELQLAELAQRINGGEKQC